MATKFSLTPNPTFKAEVEIPVAGGKPAKIGVTYRHRTREEIDEIFKNEKKLKDAEILMEILAGWDIDEDFNEENVGLLVQNYIASPSAIMNKYTEEMVGARRGN